MNITCFIGNGFDLALGLKTRYEDFLSYYLSIENNDEDIKIFKSNIKDDLHTWSDAEKAFGEYTANYKADEIDKFEKCHLDFCKYLKLYLKREEEKLDESKVLDLLKKILSFNEKLKDEDKEIIERIMSSDEKDVKVNFVNFNYTSTLDKAIDIAKNSDEFACVFGEVLHIHGNINGLLLGVDNVRQIKNENFRKNTKLGNRLIKVQTNKNLGNKRVERVEQYIKTSRIIIIYGMSLGVTDASWWYKINSHLNVGKEDNRLIIYAHRYKDEDEHEEYVYLDTMYDVKNIMMNYTVVDASQTRIIQDRTHVIVNY